MGESGTACWRVVPPLVSGGARRGAQGVEEGSRMWAARAPGRATRGREAASEGGKSRANLFSFVFLYSGAAGGQHHHRILFDKYHPGE
jgi:hypothetical protein